MRTPNEEKSSIVLFCLPAVGSWMDGVFDSDGHGAQLPRGQKNLTERNILSPRRPSHIRTVR
jgi:hypothetical protein